MTHWESFKKFKFGHTSNWHKHNTESQLKNKTHKILWGFEIKTDRLISARLQDFVIVNEKKKNFSVVDFAVPTDHRVKLKESEKSNKYLNLARELKIYGTIGSLLNIPFGLVKEMEDLKISGPSRLQYYYDRSEYWEESWRLEETCCYSNYRVKPSTNAGVKKLSKG